MPRARKDSKPVVANVRGPVLWMHVIILSTKWKVLISTPKFHPVLEGLNGFTDPDKALILINAEVADARKWETLFHELMHSAHFQVGYETSVAQAYEKHELFDAETREEARISILSPVMFDILFRNGWLNLPPIPKEASLLLT